ncbi:HlyD family efflux transporter periplasmic adaptor subunit [Aliiroseovarius sp. S1339]|uniref:efflux RND transporter periplasmic adaptor subunit n=1 Tax=Aliiroseovarius sp. S1339 TaxID=2936990 RepID=UPI0020BF2DCF|nr:HlyD family efflux transporter periplasmic adaptor subunit [Aliiroseovarius sp. S1339]MCK8462874.1 HlyD family efflux transporter periplasmic adaptor subunit [Aliiroseovarius sp. S1339]
MSWNMRKTTLAGAAAVAVAGFAYFATKPEPVPVDIVTIAEGSIEVTVNAEGYTRVRDVYEVSAPVSGQLARSPVSIGDMVVAGETIVARIAPGDPAFLDVRSRAQAEAAVAQANASVSVAQAQIAMAEADLAHAQTRLNRLHDLHARGTIPQAQLDDAELGVDVAAAKLDSAHAAFDMRTAELEAQKATLIEPREHDDLALNEACCINVKAPVSGTVLGVASESARPVMPGAPILSIGETDDLEITAEILSTDAVRLAPGAPAYVERWGGDGVLDAQVRVIEPAGFTKVSALGIEEQRVRVVLDLLTPKEDRAALGHGFRTFLRIVEWQGEGLIVPLSALFRDGTDWAVFVVEDDQAVLRAVMLGHRNSEVAEVTSGLAPGEQVVTHPGDRVADGVLVVDRATL